MSNPKPKNIVFDLGGVLIDWNPRYLFKKVFNHDQEMEYFLQHICTDEWNLLQDAGRPLAEGTSVLCQQYPKYAEQIRLYYGRWHEMLNGTIAGSVEVFDRLKNCPVNLYALTNWSHETFAYAKSHFAFLNDFLDIVVSGEEKLLKPDPKIFEILLKRNNLKATESVFIDDREINVKAAESLGFIGIQFTSAKELEKELQQLKVL